MKRILIFFCLLLSALFVTAQDKGFGTVAVYCTDGAGKVGIIINEVDAFDIGRKSVYYLKCFSEGKAVIYAKHKITETSSNAVTVELKHGDTIFLRLKNGTITGGDLQLTKKTSEEAASEIKLAGGESELTFHTGEEYKPRPFVKKKESAPETTNKSQPSKGTVLYVGNNGALLTSNNQVNGRSKVYVKGINGYKHALFPASVEKSDTINDLVLLQLADKVTLDSVPFAIRKTPVEMGEKVYLVGYGNSGEIKLAEGLVTSTMGSDNEENVFQASMILEKPYNGAPVIDKDGYLVGILSKGKKNIASLVKATYLEELLAKAGITTSGKNRLAGKTLAEQVKILERYIYLIETE